MDRRTGLGAVKLLILAAAGLAGAGTASLSCGSDPVSPCETVFAEECKVQCTGDATCANGLYCSAAGTCFADCTPEGGQCEGTCDPRGRCIGGNTLSNGTSTESTAAFMNNAASGTASGCADLSIDLQPTTPTVLLLVDQSGSMEEDFPGGSRWSVLYEVLMDPQDGVVNQLQNNVRFGLALYTGTDQQCPSLNQVPITLGNYAAIDAVYGQEEPLGDTPTGASIEAVTPQLVAYAEPGTKVIVLATDGEPDTCQQPNPDQGQGESVAAVQAAHAAGILTFIIAVGDDVSLGHQQDMANAGRGLPLDHSQGDAPYYPANDQQALVDAFNQIIEGVRSCVVNVNGTIDADNACEGHVYVDGVEIPCNDPNGWRLLGPSAIELVGTACESIQNGDHSVTGSFPCDVLTPA